MAYKFLFLNNLTFSIFMEIIIIAAMAANRVIGCQDAIPWHIPDELQRFKITTWGHPLIMGRKTYESIGRPLPGRKNIVISRKPGLVISGCEVAESIETALALCGDTDKVFVIGGEQIFMRAMHLADTIVLSTLVRKVKGDTFFPLIPDDFILTGSEVIDGADPYKIEVYRRRSSSLTFQSLHPYLL